MSIATIPVESEITQIPELSGKDKFAKRFQPSNLKPNNVRRSSPPSSVPLHSLRADDIKEHRIWALVSCILCFFLIAPVMAYYHSRRVRAMKNNQELMRAKLLSDRVNNLLIFSNIIGGVIWVAIIFVIGVLFILGAFL